jgi:hypothetical protein
MASSFSTLGIELIATGEASGLWGDKTNVNLQMFQEITSGYVAQSIAGGAATTTLSITNATTGDTARQMIIEFTGTISGNRIVTIPDSLEKMYVVKNSTSGAHTVQFKTVSGTGVTFGASDKGTKLVFANGTNVVDAGLGGATDLNGEELILDEDADTSITADTDDQIDIKIAGADDFRFTANTFTALSGSGVVIPDSGLTLGSTAVTSTAAELNILDGVTSTAAELNILDGVTSTAAELNALDGITAVVGELNALDIGSTAVGTAVASKAVILDSNKDYTGIRNLTLTGDLTVGGDDITMGTNTAGNLLVADGTNFNSIAVSSLSEISTAAGDDVFIAIDTSGGGLKKIARSAVVAGLATDSAISNVVDDTSPQLGGNLDMNGADIVTTSNATIDLAPNGTGTVVVRGNTNSGAIVFNCESNSHGQTVIAQPHSASVTNTMLLPAGASSTLVSLVSTDTLTNKTLTSPKVNEDVAVTSTATELNLLDGVTSTTAELNIIDGNATIGTTAVADGDGIVTNDGGTMRQTTVQTFATYFGSEITAMSNLVTTGALGSGSIAAGFGAIDNGTSGIRTNTFTAETSFVPDAQDGAALGTTSLQFSDLFLADGAVIGMGDDNEVTLTHVADTGILLNSDNVIQLRDSAINIGSPADGDLDINADDEVEINSTLIDINGNVEMSGTLAQAGVASFAKAANVAQVALSSSSNAVAWDASAAPNAYHLTTENTTFSAPSNNVEGAFIAVEINYNGSHTIAFNTIFEFAASTAPTFTSTDAKTDILVFRYNGAVWQEVGRTLNLSES